jgi:hypothetical protein
VLRLGAEEIPRRAYVEHLAAACRLGDRRGRWAFDLT